MLSFLTIAGGVALILFGVNLLRTGLDQIFGVSLNHALQHLTRSRFRAFATGIGISVAVPSSTTVSILAVQAIQAGRLEAQKVFAVMLGANVGLTAVVLLISFRLEQYAPVLILMGVATSQLLHQHKANGVGQVLAALGLIFLAIGIIKHDTSQFAPDGDFARLLDIAQHYPFGLAVLAATLTVILQSSTAAIALVLGLGATGVVSLPLAIAVVVGANVGMGASTLIVGWREPESRRMATSNLLSKVIIALGVLMMLPTIATLVAATHLVLDKQIALVHTTFNAMQAVIFLPLLTPLHQITCKLVPDDTKARQAVFGPKYIDLERSTHWLLATGQSRREIIRLSELVRNMLSELWRAMEQCDEQLAREVQKQDNQIDVLDAAITRFLVNTSRQYADASESGDAVRQLRYLSELETIGDIIDKNLAELAIKRSQKNIKFPSSGWSDLNTLYAKVSHNMLLVETAISTGDSRIVDDVLVSDDDIANYVQDLKKAHFDRLRSEVPQSYESSCIHLDALTYLKSINDCIVHIARAVIESKQL